MTSRHVRAYALLLRFYPRRFRAAYQREMTLLFAQQLQDARAEGTPGSVLRLWVRSLIDLTATAPPEHLERGGLVARPVSGTDHLGTEQSRTARELWTIAALAPAAITFVLIALAPATIGPMFDKPPDALGLPMGVVIAAIGTSWYALGVGVVAVASRAWVRLAALLVFIAPATFFVILGPAIILMLRNLAAESG